MSDNITLKAPARLLRILFKSGNSHTAWFYSFACDGDTGKLDWESVSVDNHLVSLDPAQVEAVFIIDSLPAGAEFPGVPFDPEEA